MNIKSIYPQLENYTYLNTAACGLLSKPVLDIKIKDAQQFFDKGSLYQIDEDDIVGKTKIQISKIYNANEAGIAITPNFSLAYNAVLDALDQKSKFLCIAEDYLSITMPIERKNFNCQYISISDKLENQILKQLKVEHKDVLSISMVQFISGIRFDVSFFQQLKADFPELIILVDATQYLGVEEFDFKTSGIDLVIASGYKWLNAGFGNAICMLSDSLIKRLKPKQIGANSLIDKTKKDEKPLGFLEPGHYDLSAIKSLSSALDLHYQNLGITHIAQSIDELSKEAFQQFKKLDLLKSLVSKREKHSNIFNLNLGDKQFLEFRNQNIILSKRGNGLRVGFHYYNTFDDLEHLLECIKA